MAAASHALYKGWNATISSHRPPGRVLVAPAAAAAVAAAAPRQQQQRPHDAAQRCGSCVAPPPARRLRPRFCRAAAAAGAGANGAAGGSGELLASSAAAAAPATSTSTAVPPPLAIPIPRDGGATASSSGAGATGLSAGAPAGAPALPQRPNGNGNGSSVTGGLAGGALARADHGKFVQFFRSASAYITGHRARTFVIVIPGEVAQAPGLLQSITADVALLHGLGVRLVLVLGAAPQIDSELGELGLPPEFRGGYRITRPEVLAAAVAAAGRNRVAVEQLLSRAPSVPAFRRHAKDDGEMHFGPGLSVVSGNYVAAKRRGVVDGVDFGLTGEVRFVVRDAVRRQLDGGNVVLLSNLGFTAAGEVLNCNTYDVGLHAAVELGADKMVCLHLDDVEKLNLPQWLPISAAREMLLNRMMGHASVASMDAEEADRLRSLALAEAERYIKSSGAFRGGGFASRSSDDDSGSATPSAAGGGGVNGGGSGSGGSGSKQQQQRDFLLDLDLWHDQGFPVAVSVSVVACCKGVKRAHLVDARLDGGMLLELYSRDGVGTMISADFYEGIRRARPTDVDGIMALLAPLEREGVLVKRTREELAALIPHFTVLDREARILGCALLLPLGASADGAAVAELGAFCVDATFRGTGRGDSLLDYVEQEARARGVGRLVLLTTRTADWFVQRDFTLAGPAAESPLLPDARRARVNAARNSQLYVKDIEPLGDCPAAAPGKRIGF